MGTPFAMVSSAKAMVNLPKLSDLTINKSRSMRKSLGRERNRLARFALEEDSLEKGDSFGKNEEDEEEGKSEKLDEEESVTSAEAHERATTETNSVGEASSSKFMALKKDTNNAKTTGENTNNTNKEQKNIRVARRRVNPATAAAVAKAKRETVSKGEENKKDNNIEDTDEDEDETHTILVRQPFETSDLELELNDSDAKATTSGGSVKVKTERRVGKSGSKSSKNFIGGKSGANGINANKTKKEREEEDEEEEDEYAVSDWKKWNERFDQLAKEDEALVALNGQLAEAIDVEDYDRASTIRDAIEAALTVDPAMKIRRGFLRALETEDYGAAAKFRDSGAGLLGWWHGVDITDYLQSYSVERDKMHDYAYGVNGDQLVYKQPEREEEEEEEEGGEAGTKAMKQSPKPPKKFTKGTIVHVTVRRGRLVGTSFTARELADANDESPLDTFKSWAPSASDAPVDGKLDKLKEILDTQYEKYTNKRDEEEESKEEEGSDAYDVNEEEDAAIKYSVKDQTFGTPYFELHVREEYDKDSKEIKFVTQPARLHYVESFRRIPVVDLNDHADEDGQKITVRRETDDDDGGPETIDDETKKKLLADLQEYKDKLASTKAALSAHEKELTTREERIRKLKENLLTNVSLLREEMKKNTSAIDEITLDTDEEAEKRRQERFKLVQEIRDAVIAKGTERIKEEEEEELDNVINTIFDAYDQNTTPEDPPSREELIKMLEDYDTLDEYGSGLLNALRADENADVADEDSLFEEEFFERWSGIDRKIRTNSPDFLAKLERFGDDALALGDALFDDADDEDDFDENDDYDDFDDFDESNIVESEGGFDSRMKSIEDLYGDPSLYDRVRVPAECTRVSRSSFLLKSEGLSVDTDVLGINAENVKGETEEKHHRSVAASTVRFERIPDHVATQTSKDPFDRLYVGAFGPHGAEIVRIVRGRYGDELGEDSNCITGIKLTGDANVPAGAASFRAKIDEENKLPKLTVNGLQTYPEELGVLARYKGQGRVAKPGFEDASWTDGELLVLDGKGGQLTGGAELGFVWAVPHERRLLILFTSLKLPSDLRDDLNNKDNDAVSALSR